MESILTRKLAVITGKGGVGKSTVAAALALLGARRGLRVIVVEMGGRRLMPELIGGGGRAHVAEAQLAPGIWSTSIDPERALFEWLGVLGGSISARLLSSRATFRCFAAAAPGASELVSLVKVWELTQDERWRKHGERYDLVVLDAPATGHALALLSSPRTFGAIARIGPIATQAKEVRELLEDPARSSFLAVAHASEMAVTETLELADGLRGELGRELDHVVVNGTFPRRFSNDDLEALARLDGSPALHRATTLARFAHDRARLQHNQVERLRRHQLHVFGIPFIFQARLDRTALEEIADRLGRR